MNPEGGNAAAVHALLQAAQQISAQSPVEGNEWDYYQPGFEEGENIWRVDHTMKVVGPLMLSLSGYMDVHSQPDDLSDALATCVQKAYRDADTMLTAADINPDRAPKWLVEHLRGELVHEIASGIARNNAYASREDETYLVPLIDHLSAMHESGNMNEVNRPFASPGESQLDAEIARACSRVLMEYQRFNYFHKQGHQVSDMVQDVMRGRVVNGTLNAIAQEFRLTDSERVFVGSSLIKQAGEVLAQTWNSKTEVARDELAKLPTELAKDAREHGMNLDFLLDDFERHYAGTEHAMVAALESMIPENKVNQSETSKARIAGVAAEAQRLQTAPDGIHPAIRAVSHGVKVLSPILMAASRKLGMRQDSVELNALIQGTMTKAGRDSNRLIQEGGVEKEQAPVWLKSHVRGVLTQAIADSVARAGAYKPSKGDGDYVAAFSKLGEKAVGIRPPTYDHLPTVRHNLRMATALAQAASKVMSEYHSFTYFHPDTRAVAAMATEKLRDTVFDGTLARAKAHFNLSEGEANYLGVTLMHHAGAIMSAAWGAGIKPCNEALHAMESSEKRLVRANGMPLDDVFDEFDRLYSGVEISLRSGLEHMMDERMHQAIKNKPESTQKKSSAAGMR